MDANAGEIIKQIFALVRKHRGKLLYPGIPFIFVPSLLAGLIIGELGSNPAYYPNEQASAIELPVKYSQAQGEQSSTTLLVVPTATEFFLRSSGKGIKSVWLSMAPDELGANYEKVKLRPAGLEVGALRGVPYPLVMVIEGEHSRKIDQVGQKPQKLPRLELSTPISTWIVFFLLSGAIFGFGASTCFINDGAIIDNKQAGI